MPGQGPGSLVPWDHGTRDQGPGDHGTMGPWDHGTIEKVAILFPPTAETEYEGKGTVGRNNIATFQQRAHGTNIWAQGPNFGPRAQILGPWAQIWAQGPNLGGPGPGPLLFR